jgi:hypothetical protein
MGIRIAALLAVTALGAESQRAVVGHWGGEHVRLSVIEERASVDFDCAHGTIEQRVALDQDGRFDVEGDFVREHGGPVRKDEVEEHQRVRYKGSVEERAMTLTVVFADGQSMGPFQLAQGSVGRVVKCR